MSDLADDLAAFEACRGLTTADRRRLASLCETRTAAAGERLLEQGHQNASLYFLRTGQVAVRLRREGRVETLARLSAPAVVGEISFLTGRTCSADVDVVVDATLAVVSLEALRADPDCRERLVQAMALVLADRLHTTNTLDGADVPVPVVLLRPGARWAAPTAFGPALARALADTGGGDALHIVLAHREAAFEPERDDTKVWRAVAGSPSSPDDVRAALARTLPGWTTRFSAVVMSAPAGGDVLADAVAPFATHVGTLGGPHDPIPEPGSPGFVVQDASRPTLSRLSVRHRLMADVAEAERAWSAERSLSAGHTRTVAAVARTILGMSVGWVLGAGGARGWSHIGVLEVLTRAGLPIDAVAGSSMGAIVGGLVAQGTPIGDLRGVIAEWPRRLRRLRELRFWRMHMASDRGIEDLLMHFFGNREVPTLESPYAANAVDIERGAEVVIREGLLREAARASMAFPGWLPPFERHGRLLVDGATLNPVPVAACRALGADFLLAVNVLGPPASRPVPRRWPTRQFDIMARTFQLSGYSMGQAHGAQGDFVLTPDLGDATMTSFDRYDAMVAGGVREAEARLEAVLAAYARLSGPRRAV